MDLLLFRLGDDHGLWMAFRKDQGEQNTHYFNGPPSSISHVDKEYLEQKLKMWLTEEESQFIKNEYKQQIKQFKGEKQ
ncbi:hypothetical protein [Bacillus sp. FSL R7-0642]